MQKIQRFSLLLLIVVSGHLAGHKVIILHNNDTHGYYQKNAHGEGGFAATQTLIKQIRAEAQKTETPVLLLSGGDVNTGTPESDMLDAEPDFRAMEIMGFDAMAIGNHEFDKPKLRTQQSWVTFPFLSANTYTKQAPKHHAFQSYVILERGKFKVAVFGLTTPDTKFMANPEVAGEFEFHSAIAEARELVPKLRKRADLVVAVTHLGHYEDGRHGHRSEGDVTLARAVSGIDVIVGGHTQIKLEEPDIQNGTIILQAGEWAKYLGRLDLEFGANGVTAHRYELIPINLTRKVTGIGGVPVLNASGQPKRELVGSKIPEDQELLELFKPFVVQTAKLLGNVIGKVDGLFHGRGAQIQGETNLGRLTARAQRVKVGADLAIQNAGGVRADLDTGDVTIREVLSIHPFGNTICTVKLSPRQIVSYIEHAWRMAGAQPVHFDGVEITARNRGGWRRITALKIAGQEVKLNDDRSKFKLAVNSFLAHGGDNYRSVTSSPSFVDTGTSIAKALEQYIHQHSPVTAAEFSQGSVRDEV